jgi:hypothetical protein
VAGRLSCLDRNAPASLCEGPLLGVEGDGGGTGYDALVVDVQLEVHRQPAERPARIRPDRVAGVDGSIG